MCLYLSVKIRCRCDLGTRFEDLGRGSRDRISSADLSGPQIWFVAGAQSWDADLVSEIWAVVSHAW